MHYPTYRLAHTTAFVTPVVEHWLERKIAQWVHPMKDRSDDPLHHERTLLPRSYIPFIKGCSPIGYTRGVLFAVFVCVFVDVLLFCCCCFCFCFRGFSCCYCYVFLLVLLLFVLCCFIVLMIIIIIIISSSSNSIKDMIMHTTLF